MIACQKGHLQVVELLIKQRVNPNIKKTMEKQPL